MKILCDISLKVGRISLDISPPSDNTWQVELIFLQVSQHSASRTERTRTQIPHCTWLLKLHSNIVNSIIIRECIYFRQILLCRNMFLYLGLYPFTKNWRVVLGHKPCSFGYQCCSIVKCYVSIKLHCATDIFAKIPGRCEPCRKVFQTVIGKVFCCQTSGSKLDFRMYFYEIYGSKLDFRMYLAVHNSSIGDLVPCLVCLLVRHH